MDTSTVNSGVQLTSGIPVYRLVSGPSVPGSENILKQCVGDHPVAVPQGARRAVPSRLAATATSWECRLWRRAVGRSGRSTPTIADRRLKRGAHAG